MPWVKLKFKSNCYQNLVIFNVLEHLISPTKSLKELNRILKKGGLLIGSTPFLYQVHGAPNDYLRFTTNYLIYEFKKKNFKAIYVKELGYGPFLAAFSILFPYFKFLPIIIFFSSLFCAKVSKSETSSFVIVKDNAIPSSYLDSKKELEDYIIGKGDGLFIEFYPAIELSGFFQVNEEGEVYLPRLNEVNVSGLTTSELEKLLQKD